MTMGCLCGKNLHNPGATGRRACRPAISIKELNNSKTERQRHTNLQLSKMDAAFPTFSKSWRSRVTLKSAKPGHHLDEHRIVSGMPSGNQLGWDCINSWGSQMGARESITTLSKYHNLAPLGPRPLRALRFFSVAPSKVLSFFC